MKLGRRWARARAAALGIVYIAGLTFGFAGLAGGLLPATAAAQANDITDCTGEGSATTPGTLAYAVAQGGTWTFTCGASGSYTIPFQASSVLEILGTQTLTLRVASGVFVTLSGGGAMTGAMFTVDSGGTLNLEGDNGSGQADLTLTGGGALPQVPTLSNDGDLTLDHVAFTGNTSGFGQAPIMNSGQMVVSASTFSQNTGDDGGVIDNTDGATLNVSDSTFSDNSNFPVVPLTDSGGAIYSTGSLTVTRSTFSGNQAVSTAAGFAPPDAGGAIGLSQPSTPGDQAQASIGDSTFTGNSALDGGAIFAGMGVVSLDVYGSTFSGNQAYVAGVAPGNSLTGLVDLGGALYSDAQTLQVVNSTFAGNTAGDTVTQGVYGEGGALFVDSLTQTAQALNLTLEGNLAHQAGDSLYVASLSPAPSVTFDNSILSDPAPSGGNCGFEATDVPASLQGSHNLQYGDTTCTSDATAWTDANPQLQPLGAYGGPVEGAPGGTTPMRTAALGFESPAVGAADPAVCAAQPVGGVDERGMARPASSCDIGAYQTEARTLTLAADPSTVVVGGTSTVGGAVYDGLGNGLAGQPVTLSLPPASGTLGQTRVTTGPDGGYSTSYTAPAALPSPDPVTVTASVYSEVYGLLTAQAPVQVVEPLLTSVTSTLTGTDSGPPDSPLHLLGQDFESPGTSPGSVSFTQGSSQATVPLTSPAETDTTATVQLPAQFVAGAVYVAVYNPALRVSTNSLPYTVIEGGGGGGGGYVPPPTPSACPDLTLPADSSLSTSNASTAAPAGIAPDQQAASCVYTLSGPAQSGPQQVQIPYRASVLGGLPASRLSVFRLRSDGVWTFLPTVVDAAAGTAAADVSGPETLVVLADLQQFPDVSPGYWARAAIDLTAGTGLVDGYPPPFRGLFDPAGTITRAQAAKMVVIDAQLLPTPGPTPFTDVTASDWFEPYVAAGYRAGILSGVTATTFDPGAPVTREAFAVMLARALKLTGTAPLTFADANGIDAWAVAGVRATVDAGYMTGEPGNLFDPTAPMTRADAAQTMARVVGKQQP